LTVAQPPLSNRACQLCHVCDREGSLLSSNHGRTFRGPALWPLPRASYPAPVSPATSLASVTARIAAGGSRKQLRLAGKSAGGSSSWLACPGVRAEALQVRAGGSGVQTGRLAVVAEVSLRPAGPGQISTGSPRRRSTWIQLSTDSSRRASGGSRISTGHLRRRATAIQLSTDSSRRAPSSPRFQRATSVAAPRRSSFERTVPGRRSGFPGTRRASPARAVVSPGVDLGIPLGPAPAPGRSLYPKYREQTSNISSCVSPAAVHRIAA
jgi:hypothetical protein